MNNVQEHLDVLIVGAGLSGIGAACHLRRELPHKSFAILESRDAMGGTWDLFRYPGIRSDSDMFTLGYAFKPWEEAEAIADGPSILSYIHETAREHEVERRIRFHHRVVRADWASADARWTVQAERSDTNETVVLTCAFLYTCTGYYRYDQGYTPEFPGIERFAGQVVHPQHWPEDIDYAGKRVVVIGSGATAVTLVPAMAETAEHVTMLQRSPSYILSLPSIDPLTKPARRMLSRNTAYSAMRWKNVMLASLVFNLSRRAPRMMKALLRKGVERQLPAGFELDPHFRPRYNPWDQRLCLVPDGDLFRSISSGSVSLVTDRIDTITEHSVALESGAELEADIIVTATGLNLLLLGGMRIGIDGADVELNKTVGYKGVMLSGIPNLAMTIGYTNASWTLKADLVASYICRLLRHMDEHGQQICTPRAPDPSEPTQPFLDLASGYVQRSLDLLPRQGSRAPWRLYQSYPRDVRMLKRGPIVDEGIEFSRATGRVEERLAA